MIPHAPIIALTHEPIDTAALVDGIRHPGAGAVLVFEGVTRDVPLLRFEAYEPMALRRIEEHANDAVARFGLLGVAVAHRLGDVPLSCASIVIVVAAGHRPETYAASRFLIDAIKSDVPIWKQEITDDGATWGRSETNVSELERSIGAATSGHR